MNVLDAAYNTVHNYPGGADSLAPRIGIKSGSVLRSKVDPNKDTHHLRLDEASRIIGITGDASILHALCAQHGFVATKIEGPAEGEASLFKHALEESSLHGALMTELQNALEDNVITPAEVVAFNAIAYSKLGNLLNFMRVFQASMSPARSTPSKKKKAGKA